MAEFPPNLDDGEHWLPSDFFIAEAPSKRGLIAPTHLSPCMDDLAQRFAALSTLLTQRNVSKPLFKTPLNAQRFGPVPSPVRLGLENPSSQPCQGCLSLNNGFQTGQRLNGCTKLVPKPDYGGSELFYEYHLRKPVQLQPQVDVFLETRARVLQRQQKQQQQQQQMKQNRLLQNRVLSSQGSGFVKLSGGTGVFHPRVSSANSNIAPTTTTTTTTTTTANTAFAKKKQVMRHNKQEILVPSKRNSIATTTSLAVNKEFNYHLTPELSLPKDWTY